MIKTKTSIYQDSNGDIIVEQKTSQLDNGRNKWHRHVVFLKKTHTSKIARLINK